MLSIFIAMLVRFAILVEIAFIFHKSVSGMRSKLCRFGLLFVFGMPLSRVANYFDVRFARYHKMGWTGAAVIALCFPAYGTSLLPQPHDQRTP
jgi:hypothetical protein